MTTCASTTLSSHRNRMRDLQLAPEETVLERLRGNAPTESQRMAARKRATRLVEDVRRDTRPGLMESFLAEYGLSTDEGVALMCLAEALMRVPDASTIDALIEDKIAPSSWSAHLGRSSSPLVNASTWALMLTGKVLDDRDATGMAGLLQGLVKRLGEPVIRLAVQQAMRELGRQFVLGRDIDEAMHRAGSQEAQGYSYSYDMLGEAAMTAGDADNFLQAYAGAIDAIGKQAPSDDVRDNPGISVKLSALHPRYEEGQRERVMSELVPRVSELARQAKAARLGFNIDAEEADRLDLSLDVIEAVLRDEQLAGWDGFGVVIQAYGKRAAAVIDWLYALSIDLDRRIMVRLVKGAYWDSEIKRAQVEGTADFPVFTRKAATDVSYLCCAAKLLGFSDRLYPQFATHNAHTVAAILEMAGEQAFEFQRLHGMGEALHRLVHEQQETRCRIYAPVGAHRDLLAYLVRRLLENGANSSFVNQIVDTSVPADKVAADPFDVLAATLPADFTAIAKPPALYGPDRPNSKGWDLHNREDLADIEAARSSFRTMQWHASPIGAVELEGGRPQPVLNPARPQDVVGYVREVSGADAKAAVAAATPWQAPAVERAAVLRRAADCYEQNYGEIFALVAREAGKTPLDAIGELREAVDFLRYYASEAERLGDRRARGVFACISPWNFPLAIFTGQIAAALAAGNGVIAKPAEATPLIATRAVALLLAAGVPPSVLQLLPGQGAIVGAQLTGDVRIDGVCFTGSTATAQAIHCSMADAAPPQAPLIAETGGLNAMIVDSTALPEQAVRDIVASAFQSAGQRCSALRILYVQEDVSASLIEMLFGAMDELSVGDPWQISTDVGPVIDAAAKADIETYIDTARRAGRIIKQLSVPEDGHFVCPTVIRVDGIANLDREVFGPVLHVATFKASEIDKVVDDINASGFGLTFGLHTRIDARVERITRRLRVGNMYVNRNQIGAVVGAQPFGGEGLSGTGPKAGGPHYVRMFARGAARKGNAVSMSGNTVDLATAQEALDKTDRPKEEPQSTIQMAGPTGELNQLSIFPRGVVLCLGPSIEDAAAQRAAAAGAGCSTLTIVPGAKGRDALDGTLERSALTSLKGFEAVALWSDAKDLRAARQALAGRRGRLVPLLSDGSLAERCVLERHLCVDTTAAGGNATLLAASEMVPANSERRSGGRHSQPA